MSIRDTGASEAGRSFDGLANLMKRSAIVRRMTGITLVLLLTIPMAWSQDKAAVTKKAGIPMKNSTPRAAAGGVSSLADLKSIGTMGKAQRVLAGGREAELYRYQGRGCITHMWFGGDWPGYDKTRIRFYIDGEEKPSIDMELFMGHGIGFGDPAAPWGNERLGKTGHPSGLYNTYKIPFGKSIRITAQNEGIPGDPEFWWIFRGVENLPGPGVARARRQGALAGNHLAHAAAQRLLVQKSAALPKSEMKPNETPSARR